MDPLGMSSQEQVDAVDASRYGPKAHPRVDDINPALP